MTVRTAQLDTGPPEWLLTFSWAGVTYRLATAALNITNADGDDLPYVAELSDPTLSLGADLFSTSPVLASVPFSVVLPDTDVPARYAEGHDLEGVEAELAVYYADDTYEARIVQLVGRIGGVAYGPQGEPTTFTLATEPLQDDRPVLKRSERIYSKTWTDPGSSARGAYYPLVFGAPGPWTDPSGTSRETSGSPAWMVNAGGDVLEIGLGPVAATTCTVWNDNDSSNDSGLSVSDGYDNLGRLVAQVDLTSSTITKNSAHRYFVVWDGGGGLLGRDGNAITTLGELLWYLLTRSQLRWDRGRIAALLPLLDQIVVAGYIDASEQTFLDWIIQNLVPLVPVSVALGPEGFYLVPWFLEARAEDAVADLIEGEQLYAREGEAGYVQVGGRDQVYNVHRLQYALRVRTGEYQGEVAVVGRDAVGDEVVSPYARDSFNRYGVELENVTTTDIIYEAASARRVLAWQARAYGQARRTITYDADDHLAWLAPGDVVTLTHDDLSFDNQVCIVKRRGWTPAGLELELLISPRLLPG